jgi:hypothetical protein
MMTRETKAGLVVSCSFLCLVGVVLYCKVNGKNPALGEEYPDIASIEVPSDPTPIEGSTPTETGPGALAAATTSSGPTLDTGNLTAPSSESGTNSQTTRQGGYNLPDASPIGNDERNVAASTPANHSNSDLDNKKNSDWTDKKTASDPAKSTYAIPDASDLQKNSGSKVAGNEKTRSKTDNDSGATLDPLAELNQTYKEANNNSSGDKEASKATDGHPDDSRKTVIKNSETSLNGSASGEFTISSGSGEAATKPQTKDLDGSSGAHVNPKIQVGANSSTTSTPDQEPPPIPAGLHNPYRSLPEAPAMTANTSDATNRPPRDANARKSAANSTASAGKIAGTTGTESGNQAFNSPTGTSPSFPGTVPSTTPNLAQTSGTSITGSQNPTYSQIGGPDKGGKSAVVSVQANGLTPGVMPSPRISPLPPAGDTAPEPNVRLGPPVGGALGTQSSQGPSHDSGSAVPPSNQFAQIPAPNFNDQSPRVANPYQTPVPATGPIQPAGFPAAKVDSYDEETYLCKQGDKFEDISTKFYQTDKYAQALLLFNRNHPRATAAVRQDPPVLGVGQPVFIPPLRVLQKQYTTAIPDHAAANQGGTLIPTNTDNHNPADGSTASGTGLGAGASAAGQNSTLSDNRNSTGPMGAGTAAGQTGGSYSLPGENQNTAGQYPMPQDNRNPVAPSPPLPGAMPQTKPAVQGQDRIYQVPKNGETFWEIARKTLGNPNRWSEIRRLNPQLDPKYPVPGGTNLKMPSDARIDPVMPMGADRVN